MKAEPVDLKEKVIKEAPNDVLDVEEEVEGNLEDVMDLEFLFRSTECIADMPDYQQIALHDGAINSNNFKNTWPLLLPDVAEQPSPGNKSLPCPVPALTSQLLLPFIEHEWSHENSILVHCDVCGEDLFSGNCLKNYIPLHTEETPKGHRELPATTDENTELLGIKTATGNNIEEDSIQNPGIVKDKEEDSQWRLVERRAARRESKNNCFGKSEKRTPDERRSFVCDFCKKPFSFKFQLIDHIRFHTGDRTFYCDVCGKQFHTYSGLWKHQHTHLANKPFKCTVCGKKFLERSELTIHSYTHTGEKPYKCEVCSIGFADQSTLRRNIIRTCRKEKPFICAGCGRTSLRVPNSKLTPVHTVVRSLSPEPYVKKDSP